MQYTDQFPDVAFYEAGVFELILAIFGTKAKAWKHEQEWRLVRQNRVGPLVYPPAMLDGIILGMRIDEEDEKLVRDWVTKHPSPVEILRVRNVSRSFELEVVDG